MNILALKTMSRNEREEKKRALCDKRKLHFGARASFLEQNSSLKLENETLSSFHDGVFHIFCILESPNVLWMHTTNYSK